MPQTLPSSERVTQYTVELEFFGDTEQAQDALCGFQDLAMRCAITSPSDIGIPDSGFNERVTYTWKFEGTPQGLINFLRAFEPH